jgi:predicted MFS family arabinose efflux permease
MSGAFAGISYVDLIGKSFSSDLRRRFFTRKQIISGIGILLSAVIARQVLKSLGYPVNYSMLFGAAAGVLLIATIGFWLIREDAGEERSSTSYLETLKMIPEVLRKDTNLRMYLFYVNGVGFHVALIPFYVALAKARYFLDPSLAGNLLFVQILGMIAASLLWPRIVRKGGFKRILKIWSALSFTLPLLALGVSRFLPLPFYIAVFALTGAAVGARKVSQEAVIVELSTEENRILYTGIIGTLNLSIAIFPILIGGLIKFLGYTPVFIGVAVLAVAARLALPRLVCPVDRPAE